MAVEALVLIEDVRDLKERSDRADLLARLGLVRIRIEWLRGGLLLSLLLLGRPLPLPLLLSLQWRCAALCRRWPPQLLVVLFSLRRVRERAVCLRNALEFPLGVRAKALIGDLVGMQRPRQFIIRTLYFGVRRGRLDAQCLVVIFRRG